MLNDPINRFDPFGLDDWRLDMSDHGGPHIQNGSQRWNATTLEPLTHKGLTPSALTAGQLEELRTAGVLDKIRKNVPGSVVGNVLDELGIDKAKGLPSKCTANRNLLSQLGRHAGLLSAVGGILSTVSLTDTAEAAYNRLRTTGQLSDDDKLTLIREVGNSGAPGSGPAAAKLLEILQ